MTQFRLVALLPLVTAAGCYNDAPSQPTLPLQVVSGPPGGAIDPGYGYSAYESNPTYEVAGAPAADHAPAPSETVPAETAPGPAAVEAGPEGLEAPAVAPVPATPESEESEESEEVGEDGQDLAETPVAPVDPAAPVDPTARVTDPEIDATLDGYGQWIETDEYGQVWRPDATVVGVDFTPYASGGSWEYTDAGWAFACDYPWGWLPFHYGRWAWFHDYWAWVPGHRWGPAWVEWRHGGGVVGWRPIRPRIRDHRQGESDGRIYHHGAGPLIRDHRHPEQHAAHWRFATVPDFGRPHIRSHLYGNLAEGLRRTGVVTAPPLRARTTVHTAELMRNRFAAGSQWTQPGPGRFV
ncbi:MAG TPA: DUF6600 domain-containing protein, partial [Kofleriaceae bacterium]|nr:DUF6600 domain-containing protein [Kofleriaceae bacterium]